LGRIPSIGGSLRLSHDLLTNGFHVPIAVAESVHGPPDHLGFLRALSHDLPDHGINQVAHFVEVGDAGSDEHSGNVIGNAREGSPLAEQRGNSGFRGHCTTRQIIYR